MENEWSKDSSAKETGFRPLYRMTRKIQHFRLANIERFNSNVKYSTTCETVAKF